jgi:CheY-like chemotaxis protein
MKADFESLHILIVDDDEVDVMEVRKALSRSQRAGEVRIARDGAEALNLLRAGEIPGPRLILLDLHMPRMNGIAFLQALREDPKLKDERVFVLTTSREEKERAAVEALQVEQFLYKDQAKDRLTRLVDAPEPAGRAG